MPENTYNMPHLIRQAIDNYVEHHQPTGSFTQAVLENNLREAVARADTFSFAALKDIVMYCHWEIPGNCWGPVEKVEAWLANDN